MSVRKPLLSVLAAAVLALGVSLPAAAEPHHHHARRHHQAGKAHQAGRQAGLHPACKKYLDRRAKWYRFKGNKAELRENAKARRAFRNLPYRDQAEQCRAAYDAFDDFDHGKFRR
ncbi:MAG: stress response protein [Neisseria sp.]|nr:stress response protein [Neisseria sp.]